MRTGLVGRRTLIANVAGSALIAGLPSSSAFISQKRSSAREIGPPPRQRARASTSGLLAEISLFDVMTPQQVQEVRAGASRDDTAAFAEALSAAAIVKVPAGTYRLSNLSIPGGRTLAGAGAATVLKPLPNASGGALLNVQRMTDIAIESLLLDGASSVSVGAIFTDVQRLVMKNIAVRGVNGNSLVLDGCSNSTVSGARFARTGAVGGYAAIALVDWTRPGYRNQVIDVIGDYVYGRLIAMFTQADSLVRQVDHRNVFRGEAVYFLNCLRCHMDQISHVGGGASELGMTNPGNDGCAIDGGSVECSATNGLTMHNSGHGLSVNGTMGFEGASHNIVRNWTSRYCDEGGVVISDQGIDGSRPSFNRVMDCLVENPGERVPESAFSCFGGFDNEFRNCVARDTRATKRMTVGYEEGVGANGADRNIWAGKVGAGEAIRSDVVRVGRSSSVIQTQ